MMVPMMAIGGGLQFMEAAQQKKSKKRSQQLYELQQSEIARQKAADVAKHKQALKRSAASHRARMSAQGVNPSEGSAGAIMDGLSQQTRQNIADTQAQYDATLQQNSINNSAQEDSDGSAYGALSSLLGPSSNYLSGSSQLLNSLKSWN
ncbi:MAG: hypothetical protein OQK24_04265 [Magnetovibrio sp.]|nr:hypothetical protein [Magnetovibrio sp.]